MGVLMGSGGLQLLCGGLRLLCGFWGCGAGFAQYEAFVVGDDECGEWESDDESYESEECSPYGEGKKDGGSVEACHLAHDAWYEYPVLDGLDYGEDCECGYDDCPKAFACVVGFEES